MHFTKPAWVIHKDSAKSDQNAKRLSIFSVHVHPDGSRIATGGLDAKIRIWSTKPILSPASELSNKPPKSLCTLTMHTGPVLTVRWAHSGRWLASGSDDEIVMIWDLDPNARGKVWGSDEVNVEGWKPLKRLPGHESDVTDVAWSPGDRYLASVGLDSQVIVWCGFTLERLRKLDQHQGFVKGVCWDPVGEFLATQSDDRSVKIWRTTDWSLEAEVKKPFEDSPGSTFFRRLSWSPDGAHITASNATNNKGFVFIAAVITRNTWTSEISLVGHENTVEVAAYNPHIFLRNPANPVATSNICSVVALGADDRSVSVWQTKSARPLIVAKEVFERQIMDLSWSWDGLALYAASSDGTLAVFQFDPEELEGIAPHSVQQQYLSKFGFQPPPIPEGYSHVPTQEKPSSSRITPPPSPSRSRSQSAAAPNTQSQSTGFGAVNGTSGERVNMLVAKRSNKKRANLTQSGTISSAFNPPGDMGTAGPSPSPTTTNGPPISKRAQLIHMHDSTGASATSNSISTANKPQSMSVSSHHQTSFPSPSEQLFDAPDSWSRHADVAMDLDVPIDSLAAGVINANGKRRAVAMDLSDDARPGRARTLGGDRPRDVVPVKEIGGGVPSGVVAWGGGSGVEGIGVRLPVPPLLTVLSVEIEGSEDVFEGRNSEDGGPTEVMFVSGKQTQWLDYLPSPIVAIKATMCFCAVATQDGSVTVYSHTGRRIMPTLSLGTPCSFIDGSKNSLLVITCSGQVYSWNTKKQSSNFPPTSILPILTSPNHTLTSASVRPNGTPIVSCSNGIVYSYDAALLAWVKLSERWWADGSDAWQARQRANQSVAHRGIMATVEGGIGGTPPDESVADRVRPQWWGAALTLGHLETKLHATRLLDSPQEHKQALLVYAKKIADEGFRAKAEELIKELFGPVYWRPGRGDVNGGGWSSTVAGLPKRDLLKDVLVIFARSKTLTKLAMDWQDTLKKAANHDE